MGVKGSSAAAVSKKECRSAAFYHLLADSVPQIEWYSGPDGYMLYFNRRWFEYTGLSPTDTLGWGWQEAIHANDRADVLNQWSRDSAEDSRDVQYRLRRADGAYRWHIGRSSPQRNDHGEILRWFGTCTDIEDERRSEQMLRYSEKQQSIGQLAGGVAHDFNNLLAGIMMGSSLAMESLPKEHPARSTLEVVVRSSQQAARLTRQLLAYSGRGALILEPVDISDLVQRVSESIRCVIPNKVHLAIETGRDLPPVQADLSQMHEVIENLVMNGIEAIPDETLGTVRVRTGVLDVSLEYLTNTPGDQLSPGTYVWLEVLDTGCGMDQDTMSRVFEPFFTTKVMGRGLGLAAVYGIVRRNGGAIQVQSTPGCGSSFTVLLAAAANGPTA
jgi:PAS domain S-box-containing protein